MMTVMLMVVLMAHTGADSTVKLPQPNTSGRLSLEEALRQRRSVREFRPVPLTWEEIGQLLWATQGITEPSGGLRTAPSAGALYPLEVYLVTAVGVYRYEPQRHQLRLLQQGDRRTALAHAALGQSCVRQAPAIFALTAVVARTQWKYGDRAVRYVDMEAGHAAQNLLLQATALGLGAVPVGAFQDEEVRKALHLPGEESPLYLLPVGRPAAER